MKITALEEYGLRCLLQLAKHEEMSISEISRREGLSIQYISKITSHLKKAGLVNAIRGVHGGYKLSQKSSEMTLGRIARVLGSPLFDGAFCVNHSGKQSMCVHEKDCSIRSVWAVVHGHIDHLMNQMTLEDLLNNTEVETRRRLLKVISSENKEDACMEEKRVNFKK